MTVEEITETYKKMTRSEGYSKLESAKQNSLLNTIVMLTGKCNANCSVCYTDCRAKKTELTGVEICGILDETYKLGSRLLYIPGEGEPTLDKSFWTVLI